MNTIDVGKFITKMRKEKELTQKQLAENLGVTDKAVSKWETGKCYPDIETIEKLSLFFNVSINEILSGQKIHPENIQEKADKNIVQAMKNTKKIKRKGQIVILILGIITLISGIYSLHQAIKSQDYEHISLEMYSANSSSVFNEISTAIYKEFYISSETVCTDSYIRYDENDEITYIDMKLWDKHTFKEVSIKYWLSDENHLPQTSITMYQNNKDLNVDGIHFNKYINFLSTKNIGRIVEKSGKTTEYGYWINNDSYMYKTIEENSNYGILPDNYSYLYIDGEIIPFINANQIEGKVFEIAVCVNNENNDENTVTGSCALINFPR